MDTHPLMGASSFWLLWLVLLWMLVYKSVWTCVIESSVCMPWSEVAGLYSNSLLHLLWNYQTHWWFLSQEMARWVDILGNEHVAGKERTDWEMSEGRKATQEATAPARMREKKALIHGSDHKNEEDRFRVHFWGRMSNTLMSSYRRGLKKTLFIAPHYNELDTELRKEGVFFRSSVANSLSCLSHPHIPSA